jgi:hypothetical protein
MSQLALDGVSCSLCHQISSERLGSPESFVGNFSIDTVKPYRRTVYGPFEVASSHTRIMRSSTGGYHPEQGTHVRQSELCATCHTLITKALGPGGQVIGQLPEQMPYQEWLASSFKDTRSCRSCHMPTVEEPTRMAVTLGLFRENVARHVFTGANFFMLRMLNRFRSDLNVWALPGEFEAAASRTTQYLQTSAARVAVDAVRVEAGALHTEVTVENLSGHKFPTGCPSRRVWLHVTVRDRDNRIVFESGAPQPDGAISGNDNDADPTRFEEHHEEICPTRYRSTRTSWSAPTGCRRPGS